MSTKRLYHIDEGGCVDHWIVATAWVDQRGDRDCWIACLSSLTGISLDAFPQPPATEERDPKRSDSEWMEYGNRVRRFLIERGWLLLTTWQHVPAGYAIAVGASPRNTRHGHGVVVKGGEMVHDPHLSREGIVGDVEEYEVLVRLAHGDEPAYARIPQPKAERAAPSPRTPSETEGERER